MIVDAGDESAAVAEFGVDCVYRFPKYAGGRDECFLILGEGAGDDGVEARGIGGGGGNDVDGGHVTSKNVDKM